MMPALYGVWVPPEYYKWMRVFSWLQFNIFTLAPAACIGDYTMQLVFLAIVPLLVMAGIVLLAIAWAVVRDQAMRKERLPNTFTASLKSGLAAGTPPAIIIAFCVLPSVSSGLFETFDCEKFVADDFTEEAHYYLSSALSIRCSAGDFVNPLYDTARSTALALIVIWPFGMPLATVLVMLFVRKALMSRRANFWTRALGFLHREYRPECYWWEVTEMARRLSLTGFVLLVLPPERETMRLVFAQVVTLISVCAVSLIQPYKRADNNTLAFVAQLMLLFVLNIAMCIKLYKDVEEAVGVSGADAIMGFSDPFAFSLVVFCINVLMALLTLGFMLQQGRVFVEKRRQQMRDAVSGLTRFKYSMNLVSFAKFAAAGKLTTHEEMRDGGALTVFDLALPEQPLDR